MSARRGTGGPKPQVASVSSKAVGRSSTGDRGWTLWPNWLAESCGAQLAEFAVALPILVVVAIGVIDFGAAYNLKHKLTNAAREAARITVSNPLSDSACPTTDPPCSIQAAAEATKAYLVNAGLGGASCINPTAQTSGGLASYTWTYSCNGLTLVINRALVVPGGASGTSILSTQVTLSYPYTWSFQKVIGLIGGSATLPSTLSTNVVMQNLTTT